MTQPTSSALLLIALSALSITTISAQAQEADYLAQIQYARERLSDLEVQRHDYRKARPELPAKLEAERQLLLKQLAEEDPLGQVTHQINRELEATLALPSRTPEENATLEALKDLLAISAGVVDSAKTRPAAEKAARELRRFVLLRDVAGARAWAAGL
ncbi:MAG: hypothetical protein ACO1QR_05900 [Chthoniobacteraceae bacterium]